MIITDECKITNKIGLLVELTRIDENTATLIEVEAYDINEILENAEENLQYLGLELELKRNPKAQFACATPLFDELEEIRDGIWKELNNNDLVIHYNKKYGYESAYEDYKKEKLII